MKKCLARIKRRPLIIVFLAVLTLPLCAYEQFNSISSRLGSLGTMFADDFMTTLSNTANGIAVSYSKPWIFFLTLGVSVVFILALSVLLAVFTSGYFQNMYLSVTDAPVMKGDFKLGINRHFGKMVAYWLFLIVSLIITAIMLLFSVVPFAMHLEMFMAGDSGVIFKMMLLAVLTILFGVFTVVFYSMYMSYMIPALVSFKKGGLIVSFKMTNGYCWYLMPRTTLFLLVLLVEKVIMLAMGYGTATGGYALFCFALNWILTTIILFVYTYYVFKTFTVMKEDMFNPQE